MPQRLHPKNPPRSSAGRRERAQNRRLQRPGLLFDEVAESCPIGIVVLATSGRILYSNPRAQAMIGLDRTPGGGQDDCAAHWPITDFDGHPTPESERIFSRVMTGGEPILDVRHAVQRGDGTRVYLLISGQPVLDRHRRVRHVVFTMADISASVLAERSRRQAERALRDSEQRFAGALEHAPIGMAIVSLEGVFSLVNHALCRITGYDKAELERMTFQTLTHAEDLEADLGYVRQLMAGEITTYQMQKRYIRKDGSPVWVRLSVSLTRDDAQQPLYFIAQIEDITEEKRREAYIQHIAQHDALTGLPNRMLFHDRVDGAIERSRRSGKGLALMMVDLDHFKRINDSLGHNIGDELLRLVAHRIRSTVGEADTVARMGGDEFVVLLPEVDQADEAERMAENIVKSVSAPLSISGHDLVVTSSVGIALYPEHGLDRHTLMKNADTAMYKAKNTGRSGHRLFRSDMAEGAALQLSIEAAIRHGLRNEEFRVHYQPQIDIDSGQVVGMEALIRWRHEGTMIPPTTFIPIAEQSGLIQTLDEWVLRTAMREMQALSKRIGIPVRLAVNLSPQQIQHPYFEQKLRGMLHETGFDPKQLEIEITEGLLISDLDLVYETLWELRRLGVSVALDDFGTGYSSLSYLARFPIDTLKIDRSFMLKLMENTSDRAVVQAIMAMAQSLKLRVIAEGVETPQQLAFLRTQEQASRPAGTKTPTSLRESVCVQGFHFSHALDLQSLIQRFEEIQQFSRGRVQHAPALLPNEGQCVLFN